MDLIWNTNPPADWDLEEVTIDMSDGMAVCYITRDGDLVTVRHAEYWVNGMNDDGDGCLVQNFQHLSTLTGLSMDALLSRFQQAA
jgi:hypothetical protein